MTPPRLVTEDNKWRAGALVLALAALLYAFTNRVDSPWAASAVPLTWVDRAVPLQAWAVWVYATYPLLFVLTFVVERDAARLDRWMWAVLAVNVASNVAFVLWPTTLDRAPHPPPADLGPWTGALLARVRALDLPTNCVPSLHVSTAYLAALVSWRRDRARFALCFAWATAIAVSTLSIKQHALVDVVAGLLLAVAAHRAFLGGRRG